jgi:hypothetical protein
MPDTGRRRFPATWWHWVVLILAVLVLVAVLQNIVAAIVENNTHHDVTVSTTPAAPKAQVRGCRQRIEGVGGAISPDPRRDTVVGRAVWFLGARSTYLATRATALESAPPMKVPVVVRSGAPVTLAVPHSERRWLHLEYLTSFRPTQAVTLKPCPHPATAQAQRRACRWSPYGACRSGLTAFSGGFVLNFRRSPLLGRCATLQVWVGGRPNPITTRPFTRRGCPERL